MNGAAWFFFAMCWLLIGLGFAALLGWRSALRRWREALDLAARAQGLLEEICVVISDRIEVAADENGEP